MAKVLIVSLQDGEDNTWVVLDDLPVIMEVDEENLKDWNWQPPFPCDKSPAHVHIKELFEMSKNKED